MDIQKQVDEIMSNLETHSYICTLDAKHGAVQIYNSRNGLYQFVYRTPKGKGEVLRFDKSTTTMLIKDFIKKKYTCVSSLN